MSKAAKTGDVETTVAEQERINNLFEIVVRPPDVPAMRDAASVGASKAAVVVRGLIATTTMIALPKPLDHTVLDQIHTIVKNVGLLE